jgi:hypothetical protein
MAAYDIGDQTRLTAQFTTTDGQPQDPASVILTIRDGAGNQTVNEYGSSFIARDAVGAYHYDVTLNVAGVWVYRWEGTGNPQTATEGQLTVNPSQIDTGPSSDRLTKIYDGLIGTLGGPLEVETPQLGKVVNRPAADVRTALDLLRSESARVTAGNATQPVIALRGLWPRSIEGGCE